MLSLVHAARNQTGSSPTGDIQTKNLRQDPTGSHGTLLSYPHNIEYHVRVNPQQKSTPKCLHRNSSSHGQPLKPAKKPHRRSHSSHAPQVGAVGALARTDLTSTRPRPQRPRGLVTRSSRVESISTVVSPEVLALKTRPFEVENLDLLAVFTWEPTA